MVICRVITSWVGSIFSKKAIPTALFYNLSGVFFVLHSSFSFDLSLPHQATSTYAGSLACRIDLDTVYENEQVLKLFLSMSGEEEENAAELKIGDEFLKAKCLMNCEVSLILEHKYEQLQQMSEDPLNQVSQVFEKSLQYVKRFSRYKNPDAVRQVRELLSRYQLAEFELCVLGNLCPETVEEAIAMVPSIKSRGRGHDDEAIEKMLNDMSLIKKFE
ncbi:hypothetical protein L2E82_34440 [Cichorium intybus]|uniref:Uncharacterized protein n=1 Tax=Cichorium intybus TaxID=13427 RepID=A0ACB9BM43_CICIN|nr:hypothetical protein L2E82_34440 [Cichorium intybus]